MRIGELAKATETRVETIRWYEKVGLLQHNSRTTGNYRTYGEPELARLSFIRRARALGFSLDQVRELLDLAETDGQDCAAVDRLAAAQLKAIDQRLEDLQALRAELSKLLRACEGGSVTNCRIIEALAPRAV
ncbi:helix-turn-helix domain-containing protein [Sandaracinobacter neustonicus]|uniref:Helix-turn-helix domain-containing protein n=1 Tax=Sandaracinobacter neustonicus TaxID=1715348 RepID=A0A501XQD2_9SPHN|nr:helix-turn-helix domain-containing protein [Sandaracinobacter neustonicus]TPE62619.1 helix-turn-helix domain-containing protein [Sandaracinobacter neustonicus]